MRAPTPLSKAAAALRRWSTGQLLTRLVAASSWGGCAVWLAAGGGWPPGALVFLALLALPCTSAADGPVPAAYTVLLVFLRLWCGDVPVATAGWVALAGQIALVMIGHTAVTASASWPTEAAVSPAVRRVWLLRGAAACAVGLVLVAVAVGVPRTGAAPVVVIAALALPTAAVAVLLPVLARAGSPTHQD